MPPANSEPNDRPRIEHVSCPVLDLTPGGAQGCGVTIRQNAALSEVPRAGLGAVPAELGTGARTSGVWVSGRFVSEMRGKVTSPRGPSGQLPGQPASTAAGDAPWAVSFRAGPHAPTRYLSLAGSPRPLVRHQPILTESEHKHPAPARPGGARTPHKRTVQFEEVLDVWRREQVLQHRAQVSHRGPAVSRPGLGDHGGHQRAKPPQVVLRESLEDAGPRLRSKDGTRREVAFLLARF